MAATHPRPLIPIAIATGVILLGLATGFSAGGSQLPGAPDLAIVVSDVAAGWSFAVVGALLWLRYPDSRVGPLTVMVGLASFLTDIRWFETSFTWSIGWALSDLHLVILAWLILAFPTGRLARGERALISGLVGYFVALAVAGSLFEEPVPRCAACPDSLLLIRSDPALSSRIWEIGQVVNLVLVAAVVAVIVGKWSRATPVARRELRPIVWALGPIGLVLALTFLEPLLGFDDRLVSWLLVAERLTLVVFPLAVLVGMLRTSLDRARASGLAARLEGELRPGELEGLVKEALGDPSASVGFRIPGARGLMDGGGRRVSQDQSRAVFDIVAEDGETLGAILHDPALDSALLRTVGATVTLAMRNERLRAELHRRLVEVEESRERIAEAAMAERKRIERDLHDGAQQGLLALGASLGSLRSRASQELAPALDEAIEDLRRIIDELRELARGVHPAILTERGLGPAIEMLAERSPTPILMEITDVRCRPATEAGVYFVVAEAIANANRHARPTRIAVRVTETNGRLQLSVADDGRGGAEPRPGGGLQGLSDRVEALGGSLSVTSSPGSGTLVEGEIPCG